MALYVMGAEAFERPPNADELQQMRALVADAMAAGAIGFATSNAATHNGPGGKPIPSRLTGVAELRELLAPLRDAKRGVAALLPGGTYSNAEMFELQTEIQRPFTWTALLTFEGSDYYREIVKEHDAAWERGVEVWPQVSCRPLVFQMNLEEPFTFNPRPAFRELIDTPHAVRMAAYRDPAWRATAFEQMNKPGFGVNWRTMTFAESDTHPEVIDRLVTDVARERGGTQLDALLDISLDDDLKTRIRSTLANSDEAGIAYLLPRDHVLFGLADSGAHVSQLCDACFATDLLGNWVREREVMPLERAIHKLSGEPAGVYGLVDRGVIEVGRAAASATFRPTANASPPIRPSV
jgi:N-acyl-D-amino-acid deacylase